MKALVEVQVPTLKTSSKELDLMARNDVATLRTEWGRTSKSDSNPGAEFSYARRIACLIYEEIVCVVTSFT